MNNINLIPNQYKKSYSQKWFIGAGIGSAILCVIVLVFLAFIPINKIKEEENKQMVLEESLKDKKFEQVESIMKEVNAIESEKEEMLLTLKEIDVPTPITRETMDIIVESAPKDLRMSTISIESSENLIHIEGKAKHAKNVAEYIILLHNTKQFQHTSYMIEQKNKAEQGDWIEYSIEIQDHVLIEKMKEKEVQKSSKEQQELDEMGGEDIL